MGIQSDYSQQGLNNSLLNTAPVSQNIQNRTQTTNVRAPNTASDGGIYVANMTDTESFGMHQSALLQQDRSNRPRSQQFDPVEFQIQRELLQIQAKLQTITLLQQQQQQSATAQPMMSNELGHGRQIPSAFAPTIQSPSGWLQYSSSM